jgi:hypothetical protein
MKKANMILLLGAVILASGCHRKNEDGSQAGVGSSMPGASVTTTQSYNGSIQTLTNCGQDCIQKVAVKYDHDNFPSDQIYINLCKNASCAAALPALQCSQVSNPTTACYTTTPYRDIFYGKNTVGFVNAFYASYADAAQTVVLSPGYSSYSITTITSR